MSHFPHRLTLETDPFNGFDPLPAEHRAALNDLLTIIDESLPAIERDGLYCGDPGRLLVLSKLLLEELMGVNSERIIQERLQARHAEVAATYSDGPRYSIGATPVGKRL